VTFSAGQQVYPTYYVNATEMPNVASNILNAQRAGHPSVLTYGGPGTNAVNRPLATAGIPRVRPLSVDEYPFASTLQGGPGSWIGHVPPAENWLQGNQLSNFYRYRNYQPFQFQVNVLGR
jgi:hypothetical protein